jgi:2-octaprenyl-6-methoxyphenol hydroxylase
VTKTQSTDFLIVGGGLVGSLLALLLAKRQYHVTLVERKKAPAPKQNDPIDTRALALNYGTVALFKKWDLFDLFKEAEFISKIHVSDKGHRGMVHIDAKAENFPYLGAVVPFEELVFALQEKVLAETQIQFIEGEVEHFKEQADGVSISIKGKKNSNQNTDRC